MSKVQSSVCKYVAEFGENIFASDGGIIFCKVCEIKVNSAKRFTVTQHLKTDKHIRAQLLPNIPEKSMFAKNLFDNTLLLANIPLEKLENKHVRLFLEKYTSRDIPS
ncbi:CGG triplet repeat-binding protein 1-like, partial [Aphis craccivora]